jgi:hypothetical protein
VLHGTAELLTKGLVALPVFTALAFVAFTNGRRGPSPQISKPLMVPLNNSTLLTEAFTRQVYRYLLYKHNF